VSRMSEPTATSGKMNLCWSRTSFQAPPEKLKTAQRWGDQQVGAPIVIAIASLPGPVNGPQSTCRTGFGKEKSLRWYCSVSGRAAAFEQSPDALDAPTKAEETLGPAPTSVALVASVAGYAPAAAATVSAATPTPNRSRSRLTEPRRYESHCACAQR